MVAAAHLLFAHAAPCNFLRAKAPATTMTTTDAQRAPRRTPRRGVKRARFDAGAGAEAKASGSSDVKAKANKRSDAKTKPKKGPHAVEAAAEGRSDIEDMPPSPPSAATARDVLQRLEARFGAVAPSQGPGDAGQRTLLDALVRTMLSQATNNQNSAAAFRTLKKAFPAWSAALAAGPARIAESIRVGGLSEPKGRAIHGVLSSVPVGADGEPSLEHLHGMSDADVKKALCAFRGVGPKTAACVLMFAMRRHEFPVDTHVARLSRRLGWAARNDSAEAIYESLNGALPGDTKFGLHVLLIRLGQRVCGARRARCDECPLRAVCRTGMGARASVSGSGSDSGCSSDGTGGVQQRLKKETSGKDEARFKDEDEGKVDGAKTDAEWKMLELKAERLLAGLPP